MYTENQLILCSFDNIRPHKILQFSTRSSLPNQENQNEQVIEYTKDNFLRFRDSLFTIMRDLSYFTKTRNEKVNVIVLLSESFDKSYKSLEDIDILIEKQPPKNMNKYLLIFQYIKIHIFLLKVYVSTLMLEQVQLLVQKHNQLFKVYHIKSQNLLRKYAEEISLNGIQLQKYLMICISTNKQMIKQQDQLKILFQTIEESKYDLQKLSLVYFNTSLYMKEYKMHMYFDSQIQFELQREREENTDVGLKILISFLLGLIALAILLMVSQ